MESAAFVIGLDLHAALFMLAGSRPGERTRVSIQANSIMKGREMSNEKSLGRLAWTIPVSELISKIKMRSRSVRSSMGVQEPNYATARPSLLRLPTPSRPHN